MWVERERREVPFGYDGGGAGETNRVEGFGKLVVGSGLDLGDDVGIALKGGRVLAS